MKTDKTDSITPNRFETFSIQELSNGQHFVKSTTVNLSNIKTFKSFNRQNNGFIGDAKDTFDFLKYLWENDNLFLERTENMLNLHQPSTVNPFGDVSNRLNTEDTAVSLDINHNQKLIKNDKLFSDMSFKAYGKGYILTPNLGSSHPDWGKIGTKPDYYNGGFWRKDLGGWFFRGSYLDFLKEQGAQDSANVSNITKTTNTLDTDYDLDFKKGVLRNEAYGFWRGVCDIDSSFQDFSSEESLDDNHSLEKSSPAISNKNRKCRVEKERWRRWEFSSESECDSEYEPEPEPEPDLESETETESDSELDEDFINDEEDDFEFIDANNVYYTRYSNGLIVVGDLKQCGKYLEEIGGVYSKSLNGYLFKSAKVKETLIDMGIQHISFRQQ